MARLLSLAGCLACAPALARARADFGRPIDDDLLPLLKNFDLEAALPDFDCWRGPGFAHDVWNDVFDLAQSLIAAVPASGSEGMPRAPVLREIGLRHLVSLLGYASDGTSEAALEDGCPYGHLALRFARWFACMLATAVDANGASEEPQALLPSGCQGAGIQFSEVLASSRLPTLLNSRWMRPICGTSELVRRISRSPDVATAATETTRVVRDYLDCLHVPEGPGPSGTDWRAFSKTLGTADGFVHDWLTKSIKFVFAPRVLLDAKRKIAECALGFITMAVEKLALVQAARTEEYAKLAHTLPELFYFYESQLEEERHRIAPDAPSVDSFAALLISDWPVMPLLCSLSRAAQGVTEAGRHGYQFKPYALDFLEDEIIRPEEDRNELSNMRASSLEYHLSLLLLIVRHKGLTSPTYEMLLAALVKVLTNHAHVATDHAKLVLVGMVWGGRLARYLPGVFRRASAFGLHGRYLIFCLDGAACEACRGSHPVPDLCVEGVRQTIYNKYTVLAAIVQLGFDALYLDFDTLLLADPVPHLLAASADYEVLVSRDFGGECLNTGVIYLKAHPDTAAFLVSLLAWLWHHPYEFSQKAFSAFLGHENSTDARFLSLPLERIPRWRVLDPLNSFVTSAVYNLGVEGWTGRLDGILIFHFLDGTGGVDSERAIEGKYLNLYDLFYDNPSLDLRDATRPLWDQDERILRVLMRARLPAAPSELVPCRLMDTPTV